MTISSQFDHKVYLLKTFIRLQHFFHNFVQYIFKPIAIFASILTRIAFVDFFFSITLCSTKNSVASTHKSAILLWMYIF